MPWCLSLSPLTKRDHTQNINIISPYAILITFLTLQTEKLKPNQQSKIRTEIRRAMKPPLDLSFNEISTPEDIVQTSESTLNKIKICISNLFFILKKIVIKSKKWRKVNNLPLWLLSNLSDWTITHLRFAPCKIFLIVFLLHFKLTSSLNCHTSILSSVSDNPRYRRCSMF